MSTRLDGFYYAYYEGFDDTGAAGQGVVMLRDGKVYGGDCAVCFVGTYEEQNHTAVVRVGVHPLSSGYHPMNGFDDRPYELTEIRAAHPLPEAELPMAVEMQLDVERSDTHLASSLYLKRLIRF